MNPPIHQWLELAARAIEVVAVTIMLAFILVGTLRWLFRLRKGTDIDAAYAAYRVTVGKSLLLGLELLVAADIIRTVALDNTLMNLATLAFLVVIRTALGWTLTVEVEGHWPWQATPGRTRQTGNAPE